MRFFEISSGLRVPVDEEEDDLIKRAVKRRSLKHSELSERERVVADRMVTRGLLFRDRDGDEVIYEPNDLVDIWRF